MGAATSFPIVSYLDLTRRRVNTSFWQEMSFIYLYTIYLYTLNICFFYYLSQHLIVWRSVVLWPRYVKRTCMYCRGDAPDTGWCRACAPAGRMTLLPWRCCTGGLGHTLSSCGTERVGAIRCRKWPETLFYSFEKLEKLQIRDLCQIPRWPLTSLICSSCALINKGALIRCTSRMARRFRGKWDVYGRVRRYPWGAENCGVAITCKMKR